jgi:uncharacterized phiE125 gp8 family phage protein
MPLQLFREATAEPLSLAEAKRHLRETTSAQDQLIWTLLAAVRQYAQTKAQCQIMAARWKYVLDAFPAGGLDDAAPVRPYGLPPMAIVLPIGPVLQIASVQYTDMSGALQTLIAGTDYVVDASSDPTRITPPFGKIWPIPLPQIGAVSVTFDAGYAASLVADATNDNVSIPGWKTLAVNDTVRLSNRDRSADGDGAMPAGLSAYTDYYVQSIVSADKYKLSATAGGAAIDITSAGGGESFVGVIPDGLKAWMLLSLGTLYENREAVMVDTRISVAELPLEFIDGLLDPYRRMLY